MTDLKYLQKLFFLFVMGISLNFVWACGSNEDDSVQNPNEENGKPDGGESSDDETTNAIDLGLSDGTLWATCNVGANSPEEYGGYYAWGELKEKEEYDASSYYYYNKGTWEHIGENISGTAYDVARVELGGNWRMPTIDEMKVLNKECTWTDTTINEVFGALVTGPNGRSIFLPAAGYRYKTYVKHNGALLYYWSSTMDDYYDRSEAHYITYGNNSNGVSNTKRYNGFTIRPVKDRELFNHPIQKPQAIDLGLSVKWGSWNVGADSPEDFGGYYAWGETEEKLDYSWSTYKWCEGEEKTLIKYCTSNTFGLVDKKTVIESSDDVAHVKLGGKWRMPNRTEMLELITKCTWVWTTSNGVKGQLVTGPNGNSIFLPAAGYREGMQLIDASANGGYWTTITTMAVGGLTDGSYSLYFDKKRISKDDYSTRYLGLPVRPVTE